MPEVVLLGKVYNARWVLESAVRDHSLQIDVDKVKNASNKLKNSLELYTKLSVKRTAERI